jgi:thioredoxin-related protein
MRQRSTVIALFVITFLAGCLSSVSAGATTRDPMQYFFQQGFNNLPDEVAAAKSGGQEAILIMFEAEDCPWCAKMKATVLNQDTIQDYYRKHFRILMMDVNGDVPMTDFKGQEMSQKDFAFQHNRVRATPVFVFFGLDGKTLTKYTGAVKDPEEFLWLGEFVASGAWKTTNFTAYKRERSGSKK